MLAVHVEDVLSYNAVGAQKNFVLIPFEATERCSMEVVRIQKGDAGDAHSHDDLEQMYFVLDGSATFRVGAERVELRKHLAVYVPRKTEHQVEKVHEDLMYVCVSVRN